MLAERDGGTDDRANSMGTGRSVFVPGNLWLDLITSTAARRIPVQRFEPQPIDTTNMRYFLADAATDH